MRYLSVCVLVLLLSACAHFKKQEAVTEESSAKTKAAKAEPAAAPAPTRIVVDSKDVKTLEKMNKAVETYVIKKDSKSFAKLCKDRRFDCFVDDKAFPSGKKATPRTVPPYASGSKMGLHGEHRVQVRYDFYP